MAHVRTVGNVVAAVHAREQLVHSSPRATRARRCKGRPDAGPAHATPCQFLGMHPTTRRDINLSLAASQRMGCVRRPFSSRSWSAHCPSSPSVCLLKKAESARREVVSQAVALRPPFSQNSSGCGWAGLAQAQLTHISFRLVLRRKQPASLQGTCSLRSTPATDFAESQSPAGPSFQLDGRCRFRSHCCLVAHARFAPVSPFMPTQSPSFATFLHRRPLKPAKT